ncbi:amidohydrolase family protein [Bdellovibrio sp. HCB274]|uniref:amidohydrolase family protein n=1 Tax=Bdellovibrio sp. HCB274 TaxID=3394361 RepID=UPI0039B377B9
MRSLWVLLAWIVLLGACSHKQSSLEGNGEGLLILKGVRLIDGMGSPARPSVNIVIKDDRIRSILDNQEVLPIRAKVLELEGKTVIPALMSSHVHLGMTKGTDVGSKQLTEENDLSQLYKFGKYGVATVLSLGTDTDVIYKIRADSQRNDSTLPRVLTAGRGFGVADGAPPSAMGIDQVYRPRTVSEARKQVRELLAKKPDFIKIWVDDFNGKMKRKMSPEIYKALIAEAHAHKTPVAAHVYYLEDAKLLVKAGVDVLAHSVRDRPVDLELISLMKTKNTAYVPTLSVDESQFIYQKKHEWMDSDFFKGALDSGVMQWLQDSYEAKPGASEELKIAQQNVMSLFKSGIVIGLGTDSGANLARIQGFTEHREMQLLVDAGLEPEEVIRIATVNNANILGLTKDYAGVQVGMKANLIVLDADPMDDIRNTQKINLVFINGRSIERR